jgi:hypothetical protein
VACLRLFCCTLRVGWYSIMPAPFLCCPAERDSMGGVRVIRFACQLVDAELSVRERMMRRCWVFVRGGRRDGWVGAESRLPITSALEAAAAHPLAVAGRGRQEPPAGLVLALLWSDVCKHLPCRWAKPMLWCILC